MCAKPEIYWLSYGYHLPPKPVSRADWRCVYLWKGLEFTLRWWERELIWAKGLHEELGNYRGAFFETKSGGYTRDLWSALWKKKNRDPDTRYLHWNRKLAYLASCDLQMCAKHIIPAEVVDFSEGLVNEYKWINILLHFIGWLSTGETPQQNDGCGFFIWLSNRAFMCHSSLTWVCPRLALLVKTVPFAVFNDLQVIKPSAILYWLWQFIAWCSLLFLPRRKSFARMSTLISRKYV